MTNVPRIQGPSGKPEPAREKRSEVDADKFHAAMQKKIEETEEKQKKKKRQQQEDSEEDILRTSRQESSSSTESTQEGKSLLSSQKGTQQSFRSTAPQPPVQTESFYSPAPSEPPPIEQETPQSPISQKRYSSSSEEPRRAQRTESPTGPPESQESEKTEPTKKTEKHEHTTPTKKEVALPEAPAMKELPHTDKKEPVKKKEDALIEGAPIQLEKALETAPPTAEAVEVASKEVPKKKDKKQDSLEIGGLALPEAAQGAKAPILLAPKSVGASDPFSRMPRAIQEIFSKMLGVITVMKQTPGVTETSFTLNNPRFASSVFFGTQITIKEYSTAPLSFNVQLNGTSQQATSMLQANADDLMAAFQSGAYNFKVNRLDTGYIREDRPEFHRKEEAGGGSSDQKQNK